MKRHIITAILLGNFTFFMACDDMSFLQIKPDNLELTDDTINDVEDLEILILGAYNRIRSSGFYDGTALRGFDIIADDAIANTATFEWVQMTNHEMNLVNLVGRNIWENTYNAINRANQAAYNEMADKILAGSPQREKELKAEASYIRGFGHFHLVRAFGLPYDETTKDVSEMGIPIRVRGVMDRETAFEIIQRSTVEQVYNQIITDLTYAAENLPASHTWNSGRATIDGANAMLAKVYFYKKDYANAAATAKKVIDTGKYSLDTDLIAKFARAEMGTTTNEVIFMIPSPSITEDSWSGLRSYRTNGLSLPVYHPSNDLLAAYDQINDRRFTTFYEEINELWYTTKFDYEYMDGIISGYNELLLIYAESLAESNGDLNAALAALNAIEQRAYGSALTTIANKETIIHAVQKERRLEMALLGERLFELKRLKQNVRGDAWDSHKILFQIPDVEQSGNPDVHMN